MTIKLRPWQNDCVKKSLKWLIEDREDKEEKHTTWHQQLLINHRQKRG